MDQAVEAAAQAARDGGALVEVIHLRDYPIAFCLNCRECTRAPGETPGQCVQHDGMQALVDKIEAADALILASPTNFSSVTAVFKRFIERLAVYAYWPWGAPAPRLRKAHTTKKAVLITSSAAPGWMSRLFFSTLKQLRLTAKTLGAKPVGSVLIGLAAQQEQASLSDQVIRSIHKHIRKLT